MSRTFASGCGPAMTQQSGQALLRAHAGLFGQDEPRRASWGDPCGSSGQRGAEVLDLGGLVGPAAHADEDLSPPRANVRAVALSAERGPWHENVEARLQADTEVPLPVAMDRCNDATAVSETNGNRCSVGKRRAAFAARRKRARGIRNPVAVNIRHPLNPARRSARSGASAGVGHERGQQNKNHDDKLPAVRQMQIAASHSDGASSKFCVRQDKQGCFRLELGKWHVEGASGPSSMLVPHPRSTPAKRASGLAPA